MPQRYNFKTQPPIVNNTGVSSIYKSYNRDSFIVPAPTFNGPTWTRPSDWLPITPPTAVEQKVVILMKITSSNVNYLTLLCRAAYTVDWGDGVIENFADNVRANHEYTFESISDSTLTSEGFKQVIVTITPQAGNNLTILNFQQRHPKLPASGAYSYSALELYVSAPNLNAGSSFFLTTSYTTLPGLYGLYYVNLINMGSLVTYNNLLSYLRVLKKADITVSSACTNMGAMFNLDYGLVEANITGNTTNVNNIDSMFYNCHGVVTAPFFDTRNVTVMANMFFGCKSLVSVPQYNTSKVTSFWSMFKGCTSLTFVPTLDCSAAISAVGNNALHEMFSGCTALETAPFLNTKNVSYMYQMFVGCTSLRNVPLYDTSSVTIMANMFQGCTALERAPLFNTRNVTNFYFMFQGCTALKSVPKFDFTSATSTAASNGVEGMFQGCRSLENVPLFDLSNVRSTISMFRECRALKTVPLFDTRNVLTMDYMFQDCESLTEIPQFNTSNVRTALNLFVNCYSLQNVYLTAFPSATATAVNTGLQSLFYNCYSLRNVDTLQMPVVASVNAMFYQCISLTNAPANFNSLSGTLPGSIFYGCYSLTTIPSSFRTDNATDMTDTFNFCLNLVSIPPLNVRNVTVFTNTFNGCISLETAPLTNIRTSVSLAGCKLSVSAINTLYDGLSTNPPSRTITVTNNPGTLLTTIASVNTTAGSLSGTTSSSITSLTALSAIGMYVTGTGTSLTTGRAVTFTDAGDLVNLTAHGLSNDDIVAFSTITTTTGITRYTPYYVVNSTADNFQVSNTLSGAALPLTTNGSGTVIYASRLVSAVAGTPNTIIFSRPQASTATNTLTFRQSDVSRAILKGWTVTGG